MQHSGLRPGLFPFVRTVKGKLPGKQRLGREWPCCPQSYCSTWNLYKFFTVLLGIDRIELLGRSGFHMISLPWWHMFDAALGWSWPCEPLEGLEFSLLGESVVAVCMAFQALTGFQELISCPPRLGRCDAPKSNFQYGGLQCTRGTWHRTLVFLQ